MIDTVGRSNGRIVLATVGSLGDLHPFLAVAQQLQQRGFHPVVATHAEYRDKVEAWGLTFYPVRPSMDDLTRSLGLSRVELTRRAIDNPLFIYRALVFPYLRESHEDLERLIGEDDTVVTSTLAFAARFVAEQRPLPWLAIVLQPMLFLSAFDPPLLDGTLRIGTLLQRVGPRAARVVINAMSWLSRPLFRPIDRFRASIGLPRSTDNPAFRGQFGAAGAIGLYSTAIGRVQPDFPPSTAIVGFAWFDSEDGRQPQLSRAVREFLDNGAAPIVMTLGSVVSDIGDTLFIAAINAARESGLRIVVLAGSEGALRLAPLASPDVFIGSYEPHSLLFGRATVVIHHGGIGTLAQALRSGRPQLIVPVLADQADNAARAEKLGVARIVRRRRFDAATAVTEIKRLITDNRFAAAAKCIATRISIENGADAAADIIARQVRQSRTLT